MTGTLEKHGATVRAARRWDERKLAYPIKHRMRGTYVLAYYDLETDTIDSLRHDLELSETVLRYLLVRAEEVPADEIEKAAAEGAGGLRAPGPARGRRAEPQPEPQPRRRRRPSRRRAPRPRAPPSRRPDEPKAEEAPAAEKTEQAAAAATEAPAAGEAAEKKEEA